MNLFRKRKNGCESAGVREAKSELKFVNITDVSKVRVNEQSDAAYEVESNVVRDTLLSVVMSTQSRRTVLRR